MFGGVVMRGALRRFGADDRGAATIETLVVFLPLMLLTLVIFEIGIAYYLSITAQKAAQLGARLSVARDPIHAEVPRRNTVLYRDGQIGDACFQPTGRDACLDPGGPWVCTGAALAGPCDVAGFNALVDEMRRVYPGIDPREVTVAYIYRRLGYAEGPFEPEVVVSIGQRAMPFRLITQLDTLQLREVVAGAFAEDLSSAN